MKTAEDKAKGTSGKAVKWSTWAGDNISFCTGLLIFLYTFMTNKEFDILIVLSIFFLFLVQKLNDIHDTIKDIKQQLK